jgi:hypothetical protein
MCKWPKNPRPVLAGLTIGPAVGITVGASILPRLHSLTRSHTVSFHNFGRRQLGVGHPSAHDAE